MADALEESVESLLDAETLDEARAYQQNADRAVLQGVQQLMASAGTVFSALSSAEVAQRRAAQPASGSGKAAVVDCLVCENRTAVVTLSTGRPTKAVYNEDDAQIEFSVLHTITALDCRICGLRLLNTAQVMAAGLPRLHEEEFAESRYEGWEELMTYEDAVTFLGAGDNYGND